MRILEAILDFSFSLIRGEDSTMGRNSSERKQVWFLFNFLITVLLISLSKMLNLATSRKSCLCR